MASFTLIVINSYTELRTAYFKRFNYSKPPGPLPSNFSRVWSIQLKIVFLKTELDRCNLKDCTKSFLLSAMKILNLEKDYIFVSKIPSTFSKSERSNFFAFKVFTNTSSSIVIGVLSKTATIAYSIISYFSSICGLSSFVSTCYDCT